MCRQALRSVCARRMATAKRKLLARHAARIVWDDVYLRHRILTCTVHDDIRRTRAMWIMGNRVLPEMRLLFSSMKCFCVFPRQATEAAFAEHNQVHVKVHVVGPACAKARGLLAVWREQPAKSACTFADAFRHVVLAGVSPPTANAPA